ncbi:MAG: 30S ribosomal protein S8 [Alphaproteobacteria bacterium]
MALSDLVSNMLSIIRNGLQANLAIVKCPSSKLNKNILEVLIDRGFIKGYTVKTLRKGIDILHIELKYSSGMPVIKSISRTSKPGRRVYLSVSELEEKKIYNGLGISILSTSKGVMTDYNAFIANVGGEVLCQVY